MITSALVQRILTAAEDITYRTGQPPAIIRCHPGVAIDLHRAALDYGYGSAYTPDVELAGMRIVSDEWLPEHVWRLCDADDTLLLDCREGTPAL